MPIYVLFILLATLGESERRSLLVANRQIYREFCAAICRVNRVHLVDRFTISTPLEVLYQNLRVAEVTLDVEAQGLYWERYIDDFLGLFQRFQRLEDVEIFVGGFQSRHDGEAAQTRIVEALKAMPSIKAIVVDVGGRYGGVALLQWKPSPDGFEWEDGWRDRLSQLSRYGSCFLKIE